MEAQKYVWEGAIPLQVHLHESEVTTVPPPPPALLLAPRIGYLPLLVPLIKSHFDSALPPLLDTVWFEYKGLPLKWNIPTGVLFDLLCAEPERPWNLTIHFRGYPNDLLIPYEGEDSVKWSFINSLKEADYIVNGNCKNVMHMPQSDQVELWRSVMNANLDAYLRSSTKLKLRTIEDEYTMKMDESMLKSQKLIAEADIAKQVKAGKVPVRLYLRNISEECEDLEDLHQVDKWDQISYINRPLEFRKDKGKCFTLYDALKTVLLEFFPRRRVINEEPCSVEGEDEQKTVSEDENSATAEDEKEISCRTGESVCVSGDAEIKLIRIQGIEPKPEIPFSWVLNNLKNPEQFLHICVYVKLPNGNGKAPFQTDVIPS